MEEETGPALLARPPPLQFGRDAARPPPGPACFRRGPAGAPAPPLHAPGTSHQVTTGRTSAEPQPFDHDGMDRSCPPARKLLPAPSAWPRHIDGIHDGKEANACENAPHRCEEPPSSPRHRADHLPRGVPRGRGYVRTPDGDRDERVGRAVRRRGGRQRRRRRPGDLAATPPTPAAASSSPPPRRAACASTTWRGRQVQSLAAPPPPRRRTTRPAASTTSTSSPACAPPRAAADLAVVTDRGNDRLRIYRIDPTARRPADRRHRPGRRPVRFSADQAEVNDQRTAYGLATWTDTATGTSYALVSRRERTRARACSNCSRRPAARSATAGPHPRPALLASGCRTARRGRPCAEPGELPQVEGMVVDPATGTLYAGAGGRRHLAVCAPTSPARRAWSTGPASSACPAPTTGDRGVPCRAPTPATAARHRRRRRGPDALPDRPATATCSPPARATTPSPLTTGELRRQRVRGRLPDRCATRRPRRRRRSATAPPSSNAPLGQRYPAACSSCRTATTPPGPGRRRAAPTHRLQVRRPRRRGGRHRHVSAGLLTPPRPLRAVSPRSRRGGPRRARPPSTAPRP